MTMALAILLVLLQVANTCLTFRLVKVTGQRLAWVFISGAMVIELGRQIILTFNRWQAPDDAPAWQIQALNAAVLAMVMIGLYLLKPLFETIQAAEQVSHQSEAKHRALIEGSPLALIICRDDRIEYANLAAQQILGAADLRDVLHRPVTDFFQPRCRGFVIEQLHALTPDNINTPLVESEVLQVDQTAVEVEVIFSLFLYGGRLAQHLVLWDVRDRKRHEETLRDREAELAHVMRLHTMGEITAELAHEINQPLYAISNFAQASLLYLESGDPERVADLKNCLEQVRDQAVRAGQIVKNLRGFVGKPDEMFRETSLNRLTREAIELVAIEARRKKATIDLALSPTEVLVLVNPVQIQQVLVNLLVNACEAMETLPAPDRRVEVIVRAGAEQAELTVADRGPGIAEDKLTRVFEPFFSSKPQGMGMGLAVSRTIIVNHGGRIWAERNHYGGTSFHVSLPLSVMQACRAGAD